MRSRKMMFLVYGLVALCALVFVPSQVMDLIRDGWILWNKEGYRVHVAQVKKVEVRQKGSRGSTWKVLEAVLHEDAPVSPDERRLVLSPYDFQTIPKSGDTVKVWINRDTAELAVGKRPVARVGDWFFQQVTLGRVLRHVLVVALLVWVGVGALRRIGRLAESNA
jgi:hypothetical protein